MNLYKQSQSDYDGDEDYDLSDFNIGHYNEVEGYEDENSRGVSLWVADATGRRFDRKDFGFDENDKRWNNSAFDDHMDLNHNSIWATAYSGFTGRYDLRSNIVSIMSPWDNGRNMQRYSADEIPQRLIDDIKRNYGNAIMMVMPERKIIK